MITDRLQLALERLQPSDWHRFERLASAFLASEFDDLRTTASPAGDEGRDSELFAPETEPRVLLQYAVSADWAGKIRRTVRRINETFPGALVLVFVSNQVIGASADRIKREVRQHHGLSLDVRDRNWFVERVLGSPPREKAAEELAQAIVDPYLASAGVTSYAPSELSSPEAIAAVTFLGLQWRDDVREKGLTKLAFEALVRAVLATTDSEHRMTRGSVREGVCRLLPGHSDEQVHRLVDSALRRLTKRAIRHWQKEDEFCLAYEEKLRVNDFKTQAALAERDLLASIKVISQATLSPHEASAAHEAALTQCIRAATDAVIFERSQAFAMAVQSGSLAGLVDADFTQVLLAEVSRSSLQRSKASSGWMPCGLACEKCSSARTPQFRRTCGRWQTPTLSLLSSVKLRTCRRQSRRCSRMGRYGLMPPSSSPSWPNLSSTVRREGSRECSKQRETLA